MTLLPAYGRDYKSAAKVKEDFEAGKDFIIADLFSPYSGKPCNKWDLLDGGVVSVSIRYNNKRSITIVKVRK